jgi:Flp pilus assembly protein TadB
MSEQQEAETSGPEAQEAGTPNLAAYFLTVGLVTVAFGSVFSLVFSGLVAVLLIAVVALVALVSVAAGLYSDSELLFPEA